METKKIKSKMSGEDKDKLKKAVRSKVRKSAAWKGAGMTTAPKKSLKGSSVLSKDAKARKQQTTYLKKLGSSEGEKAERKSIAKSAFKKGKSSETMKSHVSEGKKVANLGKTKHGSMKTGAKRKQADAWKTKHMTAAKTDAKRAKVQKAFRHKIGKKKKP